MNENHLTLTRYLYAKKIVKISLLISLLDRKKEEALFWAYELYHSGFGRGVFIFIHKIFDLFYKKENKPLEKFIIQSTEEWNKDKSQHHLLGSLIVTLAARKHDLVAAPAAEPKKRKFIFKMKPEDVAVYNTAEPGHKNLPAWKILPTVCLYPLRQNLNEAFGIAPPDLGIYNSERWIYYAARSPVWEDRLLEFGAVLGEDETVVFPDEHQEELFYNLWGYEPDEQSAELKAKFVGAAEEPQNTFRETGGMLSEFVGEVCSRSHENPAPKGVNRNS